MRPSTKMSLALSLVPSKINPLKMSRCVYLHKSWSLGKSWTKIRIRRLRVWIYSSQNLVLNKGGVAACRWRLIRNKSGLECPTRTSTVWAYSARVNCHRRKRLTLIGHRMLLIRKAISRYCPLNKSKCGSSFRKYLQLSPKLYASCTTTRWDLTTRRTP